MRKLLFSIVFGLLIVSLSSCSKSNDPNDDVLLIGKWQAERLIEREYVNDVLTDTYDSKEENEDLDAYLEFKKDGTLILSESFDQSSTTYSLSEDGTKLTLNFDDEIDGSVIADVKKLTSTELQLHFSDEEWDDESFRTEEDWYFKKVK